MYQVWWKNIKKFDLYRVHKVISIYVNCDIDPSDLQNHASVKLDENAHNGLVFIMFTRLFWCM